MPTISTIAIVAILLCGCASTTNRPAQPTPVRPTATHPEPTPNLVEGPELERLGTRQGLLRDQFAMAAMYALRYDGELPDALTDLTSRGLISHIPRRADGTPYDLVELANGPTPRSEQPRTDAVSWRVNAEDYELVVPILPEGPPNERISGVFMDKQRDVVEAGAHLVNRPEFELTPHAELNQQLHERKATRPTASESGMALECLQESDDPQNGRTMAFRSEVNRLLVFYYLRTDQRPHTWDEVLDYFELAPFAYDPRTDMPAGVLPDYELALSLDESRDEWYRVKQRSTCGLVYTSYFQLAETESGTTIEVIGEGKVRRAGAVFTPILQVDLTLPEQ